MVQVPCPVHTRWRHVSQRPPRESLYVARVAFSHPMKGTLWCGLPFRTKDGHLHWPLKGRGTYHSCEIEAAEECMGAQIRFLEGWAAEKCCDCSPYDWVEPVYEYRKSLGKAAKGKPLKFGLASLYGKLAQQQGAAPYRDTFTAGLITALTRVKLIRAIAIDPDAVVMAATDAVYATRALHEICTDNSLAIGTALGTWEFKERRRMFIVQPGLYWFPEDLAFKTRGVSKSVVQKHAAEFEAAWGRYIITKRALFQAQLSDPLPTPIVPVSTPNFIGLRLALARGKPELAGMWQTECSGADCDHTRCRRREISFDWATSGA